jgi:hypothetical protein
MIVAHLGYQLESIYSYNLNDYVATFSVEISIRVQCLRTLETAHVIPNFVKPSYLLLGLRCLTLL